MHAIGIVPTWSRGTFAMLNSTAVQPVHGCHGACLIGPRNAPQTTTAVQLFCKLQVQGAARVHAQILCFTTLTLLLHAGHGGIRSILDDMKLLSTEAEGVSDAMPEPQRPQYVNDSGRVGALLGLRSTERPVSLAGANQNRAGVSRELTAFWARLSDVLSISCEHRVSFCTGRASLVAPYSGFVGAMSQLPAWQQAIPAR